MSILPSKNSDSHSNTLAISAVFTPLEWAIFAIEKYNLFEKWLQGATIFDPTMGEGNLLEAFLKIAQDKGYDLTTLPLNNLFGVELNKQFFHNFFEKIYTKYNIKLPIDNFMNDDIFFLKHETIYDIIISNPPWQNFNDLPSEYKDSIKHLFFDYDLITNAKDMLLGGSRIDIAALVLQKVVAKNMKEDGEGIFFTPLSLLLNDGAHTTFRNYKVHTTPYYIDEVFDFNNAHIFEGIATRYGLLHLQRDTAQQFPIHYHRWEETTWKSYKAKPLLHTNNPLSIYAPDEEVGLDNLPIIHLPKASTPRQGVNTCGANHIFFFDSYKELDKEYCEVGNAKVGTHLLPTQYVYPLVTSKNFQTTTKDVAQKWVLLPYSPTDASPLTPEVLQTITSLNDYLRQFKSLLENRKGTLINVPIKKGIWWALLGVGKYNFFPYKIMWEAYGKSEFKPQLFAGKWQANQSLQAYIPLQTDKEAQTTLALLQNQQIENYLLSLKMEGTMNWAQPGKIKKLIRFQE